MKAGAALPAVLFATAITSALVVGGAFVARQQAAISRFDSRAARLQPSAEEALSNAIATWDSLARSAQTIGTSVQTATDDLETGLWVTRTSPAVYWLVAETRSDRPPPLRRRIGALVRVSEGIAKLVSARPWIELP